MISFPRILLEIPQSPSEHSRAFPAFPAFCSCIPGFINSLFKKANFMSYLISILWRRNRYRSSLSQSFYRVALLDSSIKLTWRYMWGVLFAKLHVICLQQLYKERVPRQMPATLPKDISIETVLVSIFQFFLKWLFSLLNDCF